MSDEMQAMCFFAGANSIFYGDKLLTTDNPDADSDLKLFARLGITAEGAELNQSATMEKTANANPLTDDPSRKLYYNAAAS